MEIIKTNIEGVVIIEPRLFTDGRGYFFESFSQRDFDRQVRTVRFVQDNESKSSYGVLRGLHFQKPPYAQSKLVRVVKGAVLDVAVDIRRGSPTFGQHVAVELTEDNHRQFFIPRGFAHGFSVLTEEVIFQYKCDNFYAPQSEGAIAWNDPMLGIDWRVPAETAEKCLSLGGNDRAEPLPGIAVETLPSTDEGVAFVVTAEGRTIYHAGDLHWWHWEGEDKAWNRNMEVNFKRYLVPLEGRTLDLAMVPLDPRLEGAADWGLTYFLEHTDPRRVLPMHQWGDFALTERFLARHPQWADRVVPITAEGQQFTF